jgi:hypothetical protein
MKNDGLYNVTSSSFVPGNTVIAVTSIPDVSALTGQYGLLEVVVNRTITNVNRINNSVVTAGDKLTEINAAYIEYKTEFDGSLSRFVVSGLHDQVTFLPVLNTLGQGSGFIRVAFNSASLPLHVDREVSWNKGVLRLKDVNNETQPYPVTYIEQTSPLILIIQDPGFIPIPEQLDPSTAGRFREVYSLDLSASQLANYHPAYKLYLSVDNGINPTTGSTMPSTSVHFNNTHILPSAADSNEDNRKTYMAIRSYDIKNDLDSFMSSPVVLMAQKITKLEVPKQPEGPLYSTRPDFYGKSTYTFDTVVDTANRTPYGIVFYRSSEDRILDVLYKKETQEKIWKDLNALTDPKAKYDPGLWRILFEGDNGPNIIPLTIPPLAPPPVGFKTYKTTAEGEFTWPLPDNEEYFIPFESNIEVTVTNYQTLMPQGYVKPFNLSLALVQNRIPFDLVHDINVYGKLISPKKVLKKAILTAFLPLTEQPPIFSYIKAGTQTSGEKPKLRDNIGNLINPIENGVLVHDIFPMIRRFTKGNDTVLRFTDYMLDGASKSLYFYLAVEISDKFKLSEPSLPVGPVLMVNAAPAEKPQIRKVLTVLQNPIVGTPTSVLFEVNAYLENENISKIEIYRALNEIDALSIRTMKKAATIDFGQPIIDDFTDLTFPPYGEKLHYRLVAIREVEDVVDVMLSPQIETTPIPTKTIAIPSLPSDVSITSVVDAINPEPPLITITPVPTTPSFPATLHNVTLSWPSTCYNGTYYLYKMTRTGNWQKIYQTKSYAPVTTVNLVDTDLQIADLLKQDEDNNTIYHRFRVQVENASGLLNITQNEKTI